MRERERERCVSADVCAPANFDYNMCGVSEGTIRGPGVSRRLKSPNSGVVLVCSSLDAVPMWTVKNRIVRAFVL